MSDRLDTDFDQTEETEEVLAPIPPQTPQGGGLAETENLMAEALSIREDLKNERARYNEFEINSKARISGIEARLLEIARSVGTTTLKTKFGTAFTQVSESFRVGNWDEIIGFIKETGNWQMLEKRIGKIATKEIYRDSGKLPPGVSYVAEEVMVIRKAPNKGETHNEY